MPELIDSAAPGISRRTTLKAAAWSVPVVAAAAAVPAHAASPAADLQLTATPGGDVWRGYSADRSRTFVFVLPDGFEATTIGTVDTPPGSTFVVSFDNRLFGDLTLRIDGTDTPALTTTADGSLTTVTFVIPLAIPANGGVVALLPGFGVYPLSDAVPWYTDVAPRTATLIAPAGVSDPNTSNNTVINEPRYYAAANRAR